VGLREGVVNLTCLTMRISRAVDFNRFDSEAHTEDRWSSEGNIDFYCCDNFLKLNLPSPVQQKKNLKQTEKQWLAVKGDYKTG
jgi:hypothetical protein